ncbi:MAG: tetratricopeptide repeat protein [Opitutales bacterium]|nr:tetratricopeptide repeat protein [Opitutales bacterium]
MLPKVSHFLFFILSFSLLLQVGCGKRELTVEEVLGEADTYRQSGQLDQAIFILETYSTNHPGSAPVLEALAFDYTTKNDGAMAAYYFIQLANSGPGQSHFTLMAGQSLLQSGDKAGAISYYNAYLKDHPEDSGVWGTLADLCKSSNRLQEAIQALLQAYNISPNGETAVELGNMFLDAKNITQAKSWFQTAYKHEGKAASDALLGLLKAALVEKKFSVADSYIVTLDRRFPGKLDHSELAYCRTQIEEWKARKLALENATQNIQITQPVETATPTPPVAEAVVDTIEGIETPAVAETAPAKETATETPVMEQTATAKTPEQPQEITSETPEVIEENPPSPEQETIEPQPLFDDQSDIAAIEAKENYDFNDCIIIARTAFQTSDFPKAIRFYKKALQKNDRNALVWMELSKAYLSGEQPVWAENTALEAIRRSPEDINYYLNYLQVANVSMRPERYMQELQRIRLKFDDNPEITLALARAYKDIARNKRNATYLYEEFLRNYPEHPEAAQARTELDSL